MKILFFTDIHITSTSPIGRSDDYVSKLNLKLDNLIKEQKTQFVEVIDQIRAENNTNMQSLKSDTRTVFDAMMKDIEAL